MSRPYGPDLAAIHAAGFTAVGEAAARVLGARLPPAARVLDLGCGDGTSAAVLAAAGHRVHGIDLSPAFVAMARERVTAATFAVGSFLDAELPRELDAVLSAGEVLGYAFDARPDEEVLDRVLARCAHALRPGGVMLFDLAGPGRVPAGGARHWSEGDGWIVLVDAQPVPSGVVRRIVTLRDAGLGGWRRAEEVHPQRLHPPAEVLARLDRAGFRGEVLEQGYGVALPPGVSVYLAHRRSHA